MIRKGEKVFHSGVNDKDGEGDQNFTQYKSSWDWRESFLVDIREQDFPK